MIYSIFKLFKSYEMFQRRKENKLKTSRLCLKISFLFDKRETKYNHVNLK